MGRAIMSLMAAKKWLRAPAVEMAAAGRFGVAGGVARDEGVDVRAGLGHLQVGGHHGEQAFAGRLGALGGLLDAALHLAQDHLAHGLLQPGLVAEIAVEHGLRGSRGCGDVLHRRVAAQGVHGLPGRLDEFPAPFLAVGLPAGGAAVDGGAARRRAVASGGVAWGMFTIPSVSGTLGIGNRFDRRRQPMSVNGQSVPGPKEPTASDARSRRSRQGRPQAARGGAARRSSARPSSWAATASRLPGPAAPTPSPPTRTCSPPPWTD